jgi:glycosyltransferase involved in cell wall biosynthesis
MTPEAMTREQRELDVSVVLPVYNESGHILREVKRIRDGLDGSPYSYEIIVIDDGSTDGSYELVLANEDIRIIRFAQNHGTGAARKAGTLTAAGRIVVWTDVDMTYPNDEIPLLVAELEGFDQVVGARTSEQGTKKAARFTAKWILRRLASYLVKTPIPDLNSGFRAFRRDVGLQFLHLLPSGFSCVTTMTMTFLANGYSVRHVQIDYKPRAGKSKFHWWADTTRYLTQIVRMVLSYSPLRFFMPLGGALLILGLGKLGYDIVAKNFRVATNTLVILFAALQVISIGLLADLVVRIGAPANEVEPASVEHRLARPVDRASLTSAPR